VETELPIGSVTAMPPATKPITVGEVRAEAAKAGSLLGVTAASVLSAIGYGMLASRRPEMYLDRLTFGTV
jgi:hypothetical protein